MANGNGKQVSPPEIDTLEQHEQPRTPGHAEIRGRAGLVAADGNVLIAGGRAGVVAAGGDVTLNNGGAGLVLAEGDVRIRNGGAGALLAGRDLLLTNGGSGLLAAGRDLVLQGGSAPAKRSALVVAGRSARVENSFVGLALGGRVELHNARVLARLPLGSLFDIAAGAALGLADRFLAWLE